MENKYGTNHFKKLTIQFVFRFIYLFFAFMTGEAVPPASPDRTSLSVKI